MSYKISITVSTADEMLDIAQRLSGVSGVELDAPEAPAPKAKKETPKAKADKATKEAATKSKKPKTPSVDELKEKIQELADGDTDAIKEYVRSFGVKKISDLDDAQRLEAWNGAEAFFGGAEGAAEEEEEDDPMN